MQGGIAENIEIVLVMDITGSMKGTKLENAKAAAKALIQKVLGDEPSDKKIRFALVPFSGSVNVGADKSSSGWIDTTGKATVSKVNFTDAAYHNMKGWNDLKYQQLQGTVGPAAVEWLRRGAPGRSGDQRYGPERRHPEYAVHALFRARRAERRTMDYNNSYVADGVSGNDEQAPEEPGQIFGQGVGSRPT